MWCGLRRRDDHCFADGELDELRGLRASRRSVGCLQQRETSPGTRRRAVLGVVVLGRGHEEDRLAKQVIDE